MVDLGLYVDGRNPAQWERPWREHYAYLLDLCAEADRAGLHSLWFTEHHGYADGYLPQPLVFAAAAAARTERIRIGTSVLILPLRNPVEVAEQAAVLDIVSGGRLELGVGAGYVASEYALYGADFDGRSEATMRGVEELRRIWAGSAVTPSPLQEEIPVWIGVSGTKGLRRVGEMGEGLLRLGQRYLPLYLEGIADSPGEAEPRMTGPANVFLTDDPERDWPLIRPHVAYQWGGYHGADDRLTGGGDFDVEEFCARGLSTGSMTGFLVATPERAAAELRELIADTPARTAYIWATLPGLPEDLARRNIELAATRLAPLLADTLVDPTGPSREEETVIIRRPQ
ncbi:LLM class flavin-dependent oxidoreductase [Glaciibacter sp. 2TAF33]|uniref:LLM class flavin-dependent oxidoreductase n=1 Tax=Glaciibacter sp. 2TAF33 TaxID=3233015 RepID=UPI003F90EB0C